jgi:hypothetical protein
MRHGFAAPTDDGRRHFNVITDRGKPLVLFAYEKQEEAEAAAQQVKASIERRSVKQSLTYPR